MKLKQTTDINGQIHTNVSRCIFGQLMLVQQQIHQARPDLGETWLQDRENLFNSLGVLSLTGRVNIISFEDKVVVSIKWEWIPDFPALPVQASIEDSKD